MPHRLFDDRMCRRVPYNKDWALTVLPDAEAVEWTFKYSYPTGSDDRISGLNKEAILRSLGFRPPHRSHFVLSLEDIVHSRCRVYANCLRDLDPTDYAEACVNGIMQSESGFRGFADILFRAKRELLDSAGFVIFDGFVDDSAVSDGWKTEFPFLDWDRAEMTELFQYWESFMPSDDTIEGDDLNEVENACWAFIHNSYVSKTAVEEQEIEQVKRRTRRSGKKTSESKSSLAVRLTSTSYAMNAHMEQNNALRGYLRLRCLLELRIMQVVSFLHMEHSSWNGSQDRSAGKPPQLESTDSGGRILATGKACVNQAVHYDYVALGSGKYPNAMQYPAYFAIVTGAEGAPLWIFEGSHKFIYLNDAEKKALGKTLPLPGIEIPPWSLLLCRGDVLHAGAGAKLSKKLRRLRFHFYVLRENVPFADAINPEPRFQVLKSK